MPYDQKFYNGERFSSMLSYPAFKSPYASDIFYSWPIMMTFDHSEAKFSIFPMDIRV